LNVSNDLGQHYTYLAGGAIWTANRRTAPAQARISDTRCRLRERGLGDTCRDRRSAARSGHRGGLGRPAARVGTSKSRRAETGTSSFAKLTWKALGYPNESFDVVVCVFAIFFVPDMVKQVRELWRMVRVGGQLAITTWGPRMFEPGSAAWWAAVKQFRPDLLTAFNPWERIITPQAVSQLLFDSGIQAAEIIAEDGQQILQSPDDWWTVVQGAGYRWTLEQMDNETIARVRGINLSCATAKQGSPKPTSSMRWLRKHRT